MSLIIQFRKEKDGTNGIFLTHPNYATYLIHNLMEFCKHSLIMLNIPRLLHDFKDKDRRNIYILRTTYQIYN